MRILFPLAMTASLVACAPSLEKGPEVAVDRYCDRAIECNWFEPDEEDTCQGDVVGVFDAMWTDNGCAEGFDNKAWGECMDALAVLDCESWVLGMDSVAEFCERGAVCK